MNSKKEIENNLKSKLKTIKSDTSDSMEYNTFEYIFDNLEQVVYIADPDTYEILYVNNFTKNLFPGEIIGTKCFKTFQNLDKPCSFCTNPILFSETSQSPYIWDFHNKKLDLWFHIADYVIEWNGKLVRLEMAQEITQIKKSELNLQKAKQQLNLILSSLEDTVFVISNEYKILFNNDQAYDIFGTDLIGKLCYKVIKGRDLPCDKCPIGYFSKTDACHARFTQDLNVPKTNLLQTFDVLATPIKDYDGNPAIVELLRDNTEIIRSEKKLKEQAIRIEKMAKELEIIIDSVPGLIFYKDTENNYLRVNKFVADAHHLPKEKLEGVDCFTIYPKEQAQKYWDDDLEVIKSRVPKLNFVEPWKTEEGLKWVSTSKIPYIDENDEVKGIIGVSLDITEQYNLRQELKKQRDWFETTLKSIGDGVIATDVDANITFMNDIAEKLTGWSNQEAIGKKIHEVFHIENQLSRESVDNPVKLVLEKGMIVGLANHTILIDKDGIERNISDSGAPIKDDEGNLIGVILVFRDITKEYKLSSKIEQSERKHRVLAKELEIIIDSVPGLIFYKDTENNYLRVNKFVADAHHLPKEKLEGVDCFTIYPKEQAQKYWDDDLEVIKSRVPKLNFIEPWKTEEGLKWVSTSKIPYIDENDEVKGIIGVSMDITDHKLSEQKILLQNELLNAINNIFQAALTVETVEKLADLCLEKAEEIVGAKFGYIGEINDSGSFDTLAISNPGWNACDIPEDKARLSIKNMKIRGMQFLPLKDGVPQIFNDVKNHPQRVGIPNGHPEINNLLVNPLKYEGKVIGQIALGNREGGFQEEDKKSIEILSTAIVETLMKKRVELELKKHKEQLEQLVEERTEKLNLSLEELKRSNTELEQFAYVASHDLQEPLRMVASFTQLLQKKYKDQLDQDANEFIDFAVDGARRMQALINDLLTFSRVGTRGKPFKSTDMNLILDRVKTNLNYVIKEQQAIITNDPLPVIIADDTQMLQLLQNLLSNAIKFHKKDENPVIHVSGETKKQGWQFTVKDNGIGIEPQYFDRIFIIFQRLHKKDDYGGTGIGLAVCKKIIQRHKGKMWLESEMGKGTTFYFEIPKEI